MVRTRPNIFKFESFSRRQLQVLTWWVHDKTKDNDVIIADGSVRAGKTMVMSLSFIIWSMETFNDETFGMAGKTIGSLRRNVIQPLKRMLPGRGYTITEHRTDNLITISRGSVVNNYYLFGGRDESSQDLVQGLTTAGFFFDEVALMPQSFVNQATARNSVSGARLWFNCNPAGPYHWFKLEWIDKAQQKKAVRLHFLMSDNPSLSQDVIDRYEHMYEGVFYDRYIMGLWVMAEGVIYSNFDKKTMVVDMPADTPYEEDWVSIDYGTMNATAFKRWSHFNGVWYNTAEYYFSGRDNANHVQKTDAEYADDLEQFYQDNRLDRQSCRVILDPSAKSFKTELRRRGFNVKNARNNVLDGIRAMRTAMTEGLMMYTPVAVNTFKELNAYVWDEKASDRGEDKPVKQNDHALDADRYFVETVLARRLKHDEFWRDTNEAS